MEENNTPQNPNNQNASTPPQVAPHVIQPTPSPTLPPQQPTPAITSPEVPHTPQGHTQEHPQAPTPAKKRGFRKWYRKHSGLVSLAQLILGPILLVFFINMFVFQPYQVFGSSMTPTLSEGDRLIINKLGKSWADLSPGKHVPKRGDIIVFKTEIQNEIQLIKRVIGLPGERVVVRDGIITVYNKEFPQGFNPDEAWNDTLPKIRSGNQELTLEDDEIFVSGDNRLPGGSLDSRNDLGPVKLDNIVGELIFRMFPLDSAEVF